MAIIVFQHSAADALGRLARVFRDNALRLDVRRLDLSPGDVPIDFEGVEGVVSLGGPQNVGDGSAWMKAEMEYLRGAHALQLPVLGICLGHQLIAAALGGEVAPAAASEIGYCQVRQTVPGNTDVILAGTPWTTQPFQAHAQEVKTPPPDAMVLASSPACKVQCFRVGLRTYGFQYHFETERADVDAFLADGWFQQQMSGKGLSAVDIRTQAQTHGEAADHVGERLAENLAACLFPLQRKMRVLNVR